MDYEHIFSLSRYFNSEFTKNKFKEISENFIISTILLVFAVSAGGIFLLFGKNITFYHIFSDSTTISIILESILKGWYLVLSIGLILGVDYFIE